MGRNMALTVARDEEYLFIAQFRKPRHHAAIGGIDEEGFTFDLDSGSADHRDLLFHIRQEILRS